MRHRQEHLIFFRLLWQVKEEELRKTQYLFREASEATTKSRTSKWSFYNSFIKKLMRTLNPY